ncbi:MAG: FAD binding domain-containing protein [Clostridiales bacterium]|nr:FAD binding domain-containing protein [Clostridiales bacterium]
MLNHIRPETVSELLEALDKQYYHVFAGGTDLMIRKRQWQGAERKFAKDIAFIAQLDELNGIYEIEDSYIIKTLVTQAEIAKSDILPEYLKTPFSQMANIAVRNVATVGGNIVNAATVGDSIPVFMALDAKIVLKSISGERTLFIDEFIKGKYKTVKKDNEILEKIIIPKTDFDGYYYKKLGQRKAGILSKLSVFILYKKENNNLTDIRISIGAVNEMPIRLKYEEKRLVETKDVNDYLDKLKFVLQSKDDNRSTKNYREEISQRLVKKYLEEIIRGGL